MTIFDIKPYSYWRNMYRWATKAWIHQGGDRPRTVLRLYLLEYLLRHQQGIIDRLTAQEGLETPRPHVRRPNTPVSGVTHEIGAILPATEEGSNHATTT